MMDYILVVRAQVKKVECQAASVRLDLNLLSLRSANLAEKRGDFEIDSAALYHVVLEIVNDTQGDPNLFPRRGYTGEFADMFAHKVGFEHGVAVRKDHTSCFGIRIERGVVNEIEHRVDVVAPAMFITGCHIGKYDILGHHAEIRVTGFYISGNNFARAVNRHKSASTFAN